MVMKHSIHTLFFKYPEIIGVNSGCLSVTSGQSVQSAGESPPLARIVAGGGFSTERMER